MRLAISTKIVLTSLTLTLFATILGGYSIFSSYSSIEKSKDIQEFFIPASASLAQSSIQSLKASNYTILLLRERKSEFFRLAMEQFKIQSETLKQIETMFQTENREHAMFVANTLPEYRAESDNLSKYSKLTMESSYKSTELGNEFVKSILGVVKGLNIVYDSVYKDLVSNINKPEVAKKQLEVLDLLVKTIDSAHRVTGIYAAVLSSNSLGGFVGIARYSGIIENNLKNIETIVSTPQDKKLAQDAIVAFASAKKATNETHSEFKNYIGLSDNMSKASSIVEDLNYKLIDSLMNVTIEASKDSTKELELGLYMSVILLIIIAIFTFLIIFYLLRSVITPIKELVKAVSELTSGDGDLSKRIKTKNDDELADLASYFNKFIENVQHIIKEVKLVADEVASSNNQLASTMEELATTFSSQTEQVTDIVSNMGSVTEITNSTEHSLSANLNSLSESSNMAASGAKQLNTVQRGMEDIKSQTTTLSNTVTNLSNSSAQIGGILGIINDIAEQTNLLALNAAIEAARAGDAGRGFAVVADEVRKLAERTQKATSEIESITNLLLNEANNASSEMIKTANFVEKGVTTIQEATSGFVHVVESINVVQKDTLDLANKLAEQHITIDTIRNSTSVVETTINQSNLAVGEVNTTVSHLQKRIEDLKSLVGKFTI